VAALAELEAAVLGADAWSEAAVRAELSSEVATRLALVAERDDGLLGYAVLGIAAETGDVRRIAVAAGAQRRGIGSALLAELLVRAQEGGCSEVFLEVRADNAAATRLYSRFGFEELSRRRRYYADGCDALVMRVGLRTRER
jgi:ribosomal-protein-alanine N-acetyltransferase